MCTRDNDHFHDDNVDFLKRNRKHKEEMESVRLLIENKFTFKYYIIRIEEVETKGFFLRTK